MTHAAVLGICLSTSGRKSCHVRQEARTRPQKDRDHKKNAMAALAARGRNAVTALVRGAASERQVVHLAQRQPVWQRRARLPAAAPRASRWCACVKSKYGSCLRRAAAGPRVDAICGAQAGADRPRSVKGKRRELRREPARLAGGRRRGRGRGSRRQTRAVDGGGRGHFQQKVRPVRAGRQAARPCACPGSHGHGAPTSPPARRRSSAGTSAADRVLCPHAVGSWTKSGCCPKMARVCAASGRSRSPAPRPLCLFRNLHPFSPASRPPSPRMIRSDMV